MSSRGGWLRHATVGMAAAIAMAVPLASCTPRGGQGESPSDGQPAIEPAGGGADWVPAKGSSERFLTDDEQELFDSLADASDADVGADGGRLVPVAFVAEQMGDDGRPQHCAYLVRDSEDGSLSVMTLARTGDGDGGRVDATVRGIAPDDPKATDERIGLGDLEDAGWLPRAERKAATMPDASDVTHSVAIGAGIMKQLGDDYAEAEAIAAFGPARMGTDAGTDYLYVVEGIPESKDGGVPVWMLATVHEDASGAAGAADVTFLDLPAYIDG